MAEPTLTRDGRARVLRDDNAIPLLGLGVWQVRHGREAEDAVRWALELGYRHIDTAQAYGNEESVGKALRASRVVLEAYSPLTTGRNLQDPRLAEIAARVGRTPAQVLLRWAVQRGIPVIPKSTKRDRIAENGQIFDFTLSDADMAALDALDDTGG